MKKVAIIGAGPAGMTAAYQLSKSEGFEIDLYEASPTVGGMAKTITLWNQKVDIGPHRFFSSDPRVNQLWLEVVGRDYAMVNRLTRIFYGNKFYFYPLKALNALFNLGIIQAGLCVLSYLWAKFFPLKTEDNFENWVTNRFGRRLYRIFFKTYSEKLWGIPCSELDADFAAQRIKKLSLYEAIKNALLKGKNNKHKTLVDQFAYPLGGTGYVYEKMAESFTQRGGRIHLNSPVRRVIQDTDGRVKSLEFSDGRTKSYDHIISSMPITTLVQNLDHAPEKVKVASRALRFRNTIIVYLKVDEVDLFPDQWLYVHSSEVNTGRVTNFRNWVPELYGNEKSTILCLEYWCYDTDQIWNADEKELVRMAADEIRKTGLVKDAKITDGHVYRIPKCYPVYADYKKPLSEVANYLRTISNLTVVGRYGAFKYNNQDHSILMGMMAAENLQENSDHDLWSTNTDYEYQESSRITETGLQMG